MNNIQEGIMNADKNIATMDAAVQLTASVNWLKDHGVKYILDDIIRNPKSKPNTYNPDTKVWTLDTVNLIMTKDDEVPEFINIASFQDFTLLDYSGRELPAITKAATGVISIRNCRYLESLEGCPEECSSFSVSGCPKIKSLVGCPKKVEKIFKFISNGAKVTVRDVLKRCKVEKRNIIYDK